MADDFLQLRRNRVLDLLDDRELAAVASRLSFVPMNLRDEVTAQGRQARHAWFPVHGVISMLSAADERMPLVEVGTIGREGMWGQQLLLGIDKAANNCFVQVAGYGWRADAAAFRDAAKEVPALADAVHRYGHTLFVQASQCSACNRTHSPVQRCARWLLMTHDRVDGHEFGLTQEFLAQMLGEPRPVVNRVASALKGRRLIDYSRGRISILDRDGLEDAACACYRIIRSEYDRVMRPARKR